LQHPPVRAKRAMMTMRPATASDIPLLRELAQRTWRECYPAIISTEQIEFMLGWMYCEEEIARQLAAGVPWEIAEEGGVALGFLSYEMEHDGRVKLHKLYVLPERQRSGFGSQMLAHVMAGARDVGAREVWMQVNKNNTQAIAAYQKVGFHITKEAVFDIGNGFVMDDYLMARTP